MCWPIDAKTKRVYFVSASTLYSSCLLFGAAGPSLPKFFSVSMGRMVDLRDGDRLLKQHLHTPTSFYHHLRVFFLIGGEKGLSLRRFFGGQ